MTSEASSPAFSLAQSQSPTPGSTNKRIRINPPEVLNVDDSFEQLDEVDVSDINTPLRPSTNKQAEEASFAPSRDPDDDHPAEATNAVVRVSL
jgi:hypothetical protein